jgi:hypothetical protein
VEPSESPETVRDTVTDPESSVTSDGIAAPLVHPTRVGVDPQQNDTVVSAPLASTVALRIASPALSRKVAPPVTAVGGLSVVKLVTGDALLPALFVA